MRRRTKNRTIDVFSLSFLDVVSCGFGAIVLLLVISQFSEPRVTKEMTVKLKARIEALEKERIKLKGQIAVADDQLTSRQEQVSRLKERVAKLEGELRQVRGRLKAAATDQEARKIIAKQLEQARQKLTEEMKRLQAMRPVTYKRKAIVGGIPVDSQYIIFVIDTSGSMLRFAWPMVRRKMYEILKAYPTVRGIQVMNDMGEYMFSQYQGRWIPDTPARRRVILSRLNGWAPFSNSSPVEGITRAIRDFYSPDKKISIYVLGDDFSRGSIQAVVDQVNRLNRAGQRGGRRVRIHAIGFPVLLKESPSSPNFARFAALMRRLA
ncbi:MAG: VWA domain-containing protein, partial [Thermodesulfobacteria bacterium]|nr:VWA domain-containing protein [Thermodesulfobacteriota bacterium]